MTEERRRFPRVHSANLVSVGRWHPDWAENLTRMARTVDLSEGGMLLEITNPFPLHTVFRIDLGLGDQIICVRGEIRHIEMVEEGKYRVGFQFTDLTPENEKAIRDFIAEHMEGEHGH